MTDRSKGTEELIGTHLALALRPLKDGTSSLRSFQRLMFQLGWAVNEQPTAFSDLGNQVSDLVDIVEGFDPETPPTESEVLDLLATVADIYTTIRSLDSSSVPSTVDTTQFLEEVPERLFDLLLVRYLYAALPALAAILEALDIIDVEDVPSDGGRPAYNLLHFHWDSIPKIVSDPLSLIREVFEWNSDAFDLDRLAGLLVEFFNGLGFPVSLEGVSEDLANAFQGDIGDRAGNIDSLVRITLLSEPVGNNRLELSLIIMGIPGEAGKMPGIIIQPELPDSADATIELGNDLTLSLRAGLDTSALFGVIIRPDSVEVKYPFRNDLEFPDAGFGATIAYQPETPVVVLGRSDQSHLQLKGASFTLDVDYVGNDLDVLVGLDTEGFAAMLQGGETDSFFQKIIGDGDTTIDIPLGLEWSLSGGIRLKGGGGFEVAVYPHLEIGPIIVDTVRIRANASTDGDPIITTSVGVVLTGELGPLVFTIDDIGLALDADFSGGNAGPLDLSLGFNPPNGIGLAIDSQGFSGGGFLYLDVDNGRYMGGLELKFQDTLSLAAIGILDTQLPSGEDGFSLLISISAEFPAIQLGFGFTLNGVGGLLGLNRTMELDILRERVKTGATDHILFPTNIVANADQIIADLSDIFPVFENQFVFGPMAKLGWGTPSLITAEIGLLIEVPDPFQVAILGVLKAAFPDEDGGIVVIKVAFLGTIDLEAGLISFDASIYDSKLVTFTLSGDMAVRLAWGSEPNMLLAVGGFHPSYDPPPLSLPDLARLTVSLVSGNNPRITLEAYLAVTSNTVQVGSRAEIYAEAWKIYVYGTVGFDALFQFSPFYFIITASAMMEVGMGNKVLMSVSLVLNLEGPTPWKANGTASFKVLGIKVEVSFQKTFGQSKDTSLPDVPVLPLLVEALEHPGNWIAELPSRTSQWVTLKDAGDDGLVAHPAGMLTLSQKVVPLEFTLVTFGNQKPSDASYFEIARVTSNTEELDTSDVTEYFAPAQYENMTDSEKISRPSFERMNSGVQIESGTELSAGGMVSRDVEYEAIYIDTNYLRLFAGKLSQLSDVFKSLIRGGSVAKASYSYQKTKLSALATERIEVAHEEFTVVTSAHLTPYDAESTRGSEAEARNYMDRLIAQNPNLASEIDVVANYEVDAA